MSDNAEQKTGLKKLTLDELEKAAWHIVKKCQLQRQGKITLRIIAIDHLNTLKQGDKFSLNEITTSAYRYMVDEDKRMLEGSTKWDKLTSRVIGLMNRLIKEGLVEKNGWGTYKKL